jgi:hypothetical protein
LGSDRAPRSSYVDIFVEVGDPRVVAAPILKWVGVVPDRGAWARQEFLRQLGPVVPAVEKSGLAGSCLMYLGEGWGRSVNGGPLMPALTAILIHRGGPRPWGSVRLHYQVDVPPQRGRYGQRYGQFVP